MLVCANNLFISSDVRGGVWRKVRTAGLLWLGQRRKRTDAPTKERPTETGSLSSDRYATNLLFVDYAESDYAEFLTL